MFFAATHNFTSDTIVPKDYSADLKPTNGVVCTSEDIHCVRQNCFIGSVALKEFDYVSTIMCSEIAGTEAYKLRSLLMPMCSTVAWALFAKTIGLGLIFWKSTKNFNLSGAILLSNSALISQVSWGSPAVMRSLWSLYTPWILVATLISINYTKQLNYKLFEYIYVAPFIIDIFHK